MSKIEDEFRERGTYRGRTLKFRPADAIAFVRRCREKKVIVFGVDGFYLTATTTQPDMNESIDLSLPPYRGQDCWKLAEEFIGERQDSDLFFEVVADE
ncbi:MAG: hypothetical protein KDA33_16660 [Phycisphaerales bacterium]|nr:hypothetical protein [Phycisphaerales bacterium]